MVEEEEERSLVGEEEGRGRGKRGETKRDEEEQRGRKKGGERTQTEKGETNEKKKT